jgi:hypothetical protein
MCIVWGGAQNKSHISSKSFNQEFGPTVKPEKIIYYSLNNSGVNKKPKLEDGFCQEEACQVRKHICSHEIIVEL